MTDATTNFVIGSGVVLGVGSIVNQQMPNMKLIFAGAVVVVGLSVLDNVEPQLSTGFSAIIFIALCAKYLPNAIDKLGFSGGGSGNNISAPTGGPSNASSSDTSTTTTQPVSAFTPTFSGVTPNTTQSGVTPSMPNTNTSTGATSI
jgi:hypothetical protein